MNEVKNPAPSMEASSLKHNKQKTLQTNHHIIITSNYHKILPRPKARSE